MDLYQKSQISRAPISAAITGSVVWGLARCGLVSDILRTCAFRLVRRVSRKKAPSRLPVRLSAFSSLRVPSSILRYLFIDPYLATATLDTLA